MRIPVLILTLGLLLLVASATIGRAEDADAHIGTGSKSVSMPIPSRGGDDDPGQDRPSSLPGELSVGRRRALIIGISKYRDPSQNLRSASTDAQALAQFFRENEKILGKFETTVLADHHALRDRIQSEVLDLSDWGRGGDTLLLFFSGHSFLNNSGRAFLYPYDGTISNLQRSGIELAKVFRTINLSAASSKIIFLDCCFAGSSGVDPRLRRPGQSVGISAKDFETLESGPGVFVLTSSEGNQYSWEDPASNMGYFTKHLLGGLGGKADGQFATRGFGNGDGWVSSSELANFVRVMVTNDVKKNLGERQTPRRRLDSSDEIYLSFLGPGRVARMPRPPPPDPVEVPLLTPPSPGPPPDLIASPGPPPRVVPTPAPVASIPPPTPRGSPDPRSGGVGVGQPSGAPSVQPLPPPPSLPPSPSPAPVFPVGPEVAVASASPAPPPTSPIPVFGHSPGPPPPEETLIPQGKNPQGFEQFLSPVDGAIMVKIPAGKFIRGSKYGDEDEKPVKEIHLSEFLIDKYEVSNLQYKRFVDATQYVTLAERAGKARVYIKRRGWQIKDGANWKQPLGPGFNIKDRNLMDHPVTCLAWADCEAYLKWAGKRFPTEAEWEKAARGQTAQRYPWGDQDPQEDVVRARANYGEGNNDNDWTDDGWFYTAPVTRFTEGASPYGVYNMAGNVWEWCRDWFRPDFYEVGPVRDPLNLEGGRERLVRGGSYSSGSSQLRCSYRNAVKPDDYSNCIGFRGAMSINRVTGASDSE